MSNLVFHLTYCDLSSSQLHINISFQYASIENHIFAVVKGIAVILAMIIFSTSVKASAFVAGAAGALGAISTVSTTCCKTTHHADVAECGDSEEEQEDKGCCEGDGCNCACCLHIAFLQQLSPNAIQSTNFSDVKFGYSFLYQASYLKSVFHPPAFL